VHLQIRIRFVGDKRTRPARRLQNDFGVNNKYWGIMGNVSLHGRSAKTIVTTLAATAAANATSINTIDSTGWSPGDEIFITASGHLFGEHDHAVIESVSGNTIKLTKPLTHMHYGTDVLFTNEVLVKKTRFKSADMSARVVLLTRSIVVENVDSGDGWGPVMVVGQVCRISSARLMLTWM
jgi:phosphotransferase system HPr-like phosphotransfer protein